jgi:hypothetical protein
VVDLTGSLVVTSTGLAAVNGLANLQTVEGNVTISSNASLSNVGGLTGLKTVMGYLDIESNGALTNVNGLSALASVGGYFQLYNNVVLTNVGGLANLTTVGGYVNIQYNTVLANLGGLAKLASVGTTINDYLQIYGNNALTSITGLIRPTTGKLASLAGNLTVVGNGALITCQADALKAALAAVGWARTYSQSSNLACVGPKACVGAVCQ